MAHKRKELCDQVRGICILLISILLDEMQSTLKIMAKEHNRMVVRSVPNRQSNKKIHQEMHDFCASQNSHYNSQSS